MSSYYRQQLEEWLQTISVQAERVLDVGGAQKPVSGRVGGWDVQQYAILDLPNYDVEEEMQGDNADVVFCLELMEYVINPVRVVENLQGLLKVGGLLYISFPFVYPFHQETERDSLRYTRTGVGRLLKPYFDILDMQDRIGRTPALLEGFYKDDGMHIAGDADVTGFLVTAKKR